MADITLVYGATTLSIQPANFNDRREVLPVQARSRTHDGQLVVGDKDLTIRRFQLQWNDLTYAERGEFETFFGPSNVHGSLNRFQYTDHFGVTYWVRLITDVQSYLNVFTNLWTVGFEFEQDDPSEES